MIETAKNLISIVANAIATNTIEEAIEYLEDTMPEDEASAELQQHTIDVLAQKEQNITI